MDVGDFKVAPNCIEHVFILYTCTQKIAVSPEASLCPAPLKRNLTITMTWQESNRHISKCVFMYTRANCMPHLSSINAVQSVISIRAPAHTVQHKGHSSTQRRCLASTEQVGRWANTAIADIKI